MDKESGGADRIQGALASPLRVLFIHRSYPNTFSQVVDVLAQRSGLRCAYMVENRYQHMIKASAPRVTFFGYDLDDAPRASGAYQHTAALERWVRRGIGVARAVRELYPRYVFDVIVGSATTGCTLYLRGAVNSAIVSYCEHPNYPFQHARKEFPPTFEQYVFDIGHRAMVLTSVVHSELGLVASEYARSLFPSEFRPKVYVQSEGFPLHPQPGNVHHLRERLGLPSGEPLIGFFGRSLEAVRGFDIFLKVVKRIRQIRPEVQTLVIGSEQTLYGNEKLHLGRMSFKQYALAQAGMKEEEIIWRDFLPYKEFIAHLACLDLAILPTFEGASNWSFFDAMASGVAILSSNRSYVPELIRHGQEGYLFDPYDIEGYVEATLRLLDQPNERIRIGRNARERIRRHHTPECAANGYERIIRRAYALR